MKDIDWYVLFQCLFVPRQSIRLSCDSLCRTVYFVSSEDSIRTVLHGPLTLYTPPHTHPSSCCGFVTNHGLCHADDVEGTPNQPTADASRRNGWKCSSLKSNKCRPK
jgi:hypothetical protein